MPANRLSARLAAVLAAATAAALAGTGCGVLRNEFSDTYSERAAVTEVRIDGGAGSVTVRPGSAAAVEITRTVRTTADKPDPTHHVDGAVLHLSTDCGRMCTASYEVLAPNRVKVSGRDGSGDITLTGVSAVDVTTGSGRIRVTDATGPVRVSAGSGEIDLTDVAGRTDAKTGSGNIDARELRSEDVNLTASSGNVELRLSVPADVRAATGSGNVTVAVPEGGAYRVDADTGSGDLRVDIHGHGKVGVWGV
ncbi:MAG TPA: DUF4097 family beta strand repeat-containing protein [Micromonosporaceae bacterium]|nr:DUF4097 family beta strand repeat-containing protein [Micromonosporaceae bacterium]